MNTLHVIIGAGPVGSAVATSLLKKGERVRMVSRSGSHPVGGTEVVSADVSTNSGAAEAVADASVVYQCAQPPYHRWAEEFAPLQQTILDATAAAGASLVIADNLYSYGDPEGATITEDTPERASTKKGMVRREMARDALAAHNEGRLRVAVTRPSNYFGPGYQQSGTTIFAKAAAGKSMQFLGLADTPRSFSFVPDVGAAMAAIGTSDSGWGRVWITAMQPAMTQSEFAQRVWALAGQDGAAKTSFVGPRMLTLAGLFSPTIREVIEMQYEFDRPFVASSAAFEVEFGLAPTPPDEAIAETLRAFSPATR